MKIPAEFAPKSWEMPPGFRVLEESASVVTREFDGEKLDWLVALIEIPAFPKPIFWMRLCDSRDDAGFVVYDDIHAQTQAGSVSYEPSYIYEASFTEELHAKILDLVFKNANYQRQFILNENGELRQSNEAASEAILVDAVGYASWSLGAIRLEKHDKSTFTWDSMMTPAKFRRLPALELWQQLQIPILKLEGDCAFARRLALLKKCERHKLIHSEASIYKEEFEATLRAFVIAQDFWNVKDFDGEIYLNFYNDGTIHLTLEGDECPVSAEFEKFATELYQLYLPVNEDIAEYSCVKRWLERFDAIVELSIPCPTAHEQLEAQLRWREWKANHEKI